MAQRPSVMPLRSVKAASDTSWDDMAVPVRRGHFGRSISGTEPDCGPGSLEFDTLAWATEGSGVRPSSCFRGTWSASCSGSDQRAEEQAVCDAVALGWPADC